MKTKPVDPTIIINLKDHYIATSEFYSHVIDSLHDYSVFTMDNDININSWNSGSEKIFGYTTKEIIGKPFNIIFTEEDQKKEVARKEIETAEKEGKAEDVRWHITKSGRQFYANGLVFPIISKGNEKLGYVKILQDVTAEKKSQEAIKKHVKDLEELITHKENILAILSHDLRSPLTGIIGITDYVESTFEEMNAEEAREMFALINESTKKELNMLDYLVEWARIKYAEDAFKPTKLQLAAHVKEVFDTLNEVANLNTINLHHEIAENTNVFADKKMLLSVLQNIVSNAIKHSKPGGKISVAAKKDGGKIIVEIKDTGSGMSKEIQAKLFTPQLIALSQERKEDKGAGIGLLLVKGFLEKNGGEIWVESTEGQGSSFYFTLPINKRREKSKNKSRVTEI